MKGSSSDLVVTAIAPLVWGSTYIVSTKFLAEFSPVIIALLRALPAGLLLLVIARQLPKGIWWPRIFILGALNISIFLTLLFVAAHRLPGGVAGTLLSSQPLLVVFLAVAMLSLPLRPRAVIGALLGMLGVALLVLKPAATLDAVGIAAGIGGAVSMALGVTLSRKWQPHVSSLTFAAWQLTAGGLLLVPVVLLTGQPIPVPTLPNLLGLLWLGLIGAALTYVLWFRGVGRLSPAAVSSLGLLSPLTAVLLGWIFLDERLAVPQLLGIAMVIGSIGLIQSANPPSVADHRVPGKRSLSPTLGKSE